MERMIEDRRWRRGSTDRRMYVRTYVYVRDGRGGPGGGGEGFMDRFFDFCLNIDLMVKKMGLPY